MQSQVFAEVSELVQSSLDGYSVCVMAYGQTGAGKTHTMTGGGSPEAKGLVPRTLEKVCVCVSPGLWPMRCHVVGSLCSRCWR